MHAPLLADQVTDLEGILSAPRFATYLRETQGDRIRAMQLYCWNTDISAAFYIMLQFCELAIRNGAVEALEAAIGPNWHHNRGFRYTLPRLANGRGYQPADDLESCARRLPTAGKVVAELKFAFWQYLFVTGQDQRLWMPHFATCFPGADPNLTVNQARAAVFDDIERIRKFRNRIAHHEPIFTRQLADDRDRISKLIHWRRPSSAAWLNGVERVSALLATRP